jgi:hypothetical protein
VLHTFAHQNASAIGQSAPVTHIHEVTRAGAAQRTAHSTADRSGGRASARAGSATSARCVRGVQHLGAVVHRFHHTRLAHGVIEPLAFAHICHCSKQIHRTTPHTAKWNQCQSKEARKPNPDHANRYLALITPTPFTHTAVAPTFLVHTAMSFSSCENVQPSFTESAHRSYNQEM